MTKRGGRHRHRTRRWCRPKGPRKPGVRCRPVVAVSRRARPSPEAHAGESVAARPGSPAPRRASASGWARRPTPGSAFRGPARRPYPARRRPRQHGGPFSEEHRAREGPQEPRVEAPSSCTTRTARRRGGAARRAWGSWRPSPPGGRPWGRRHARGAPMLASPPPQRRRAQAASAPAPPPRAAVLVPSTHVLAPPPPPTAPGSPRRARPRRPAPPPRRPRCRQRRRGAPAALPANLGQTGIRR